MKEKEKEMEKREMERRGLDWGLERRIQRLVCDWVVGWFG